FETAPITGIHLWFDRQISHLDHAVLLDRTIQWMFHKSRLQPIRTQAGTGTAGSYIELVVSSSKTLIDKSRAEIVDLALGEVREFFPAADWTATGWPATMEGAVRSGYLAAEALARAAGLKDSRFLSPDLPATGLMRLFA